ncbi:acetyl-CoA carboxylase carboxyl transferase subunit alpha, partial [Klebsiella pneumoniae]|nr:acetyl-CoA carboxylase carboxyl transferase subunit alpha [Klebsiella pneumoniae]
LLDMAERFNLPVFTFVDTMGAYPGVGAEERGQAEAIATSLAQLSGLKVPVIATVLGEGGSGGALGIGVADRVIMLSHSI